MPAFKCDSLVREAQCPLGAGTQPALEQRKTLHSQRLKNSEDTLLTSKTFTIGCPYLERRRVRTGGGYSDSEIMGGKFRRGARYIVVVVHAAVGAPFLDPPDWEILARSVYHNVLPLGIWSWGRGFMECRGIR